MPLDENGFELLTLAQIKEQIEQEFREAFGAGIDLTPDSNFGKLVGILADREFNLRQDDQAVYGSQYVSASGVSLDRVVELVGIVRKSASPSTATIYAAGTPGTTIAAGSLFAVQDTGDQFESLAEVILAGVGQLGVLSLTQAAGVATLQTDANHGLNADDYVFVIGADQVEYNGLQKVTNVTALDEFEFAVDPGAISPATGTITIQTTTPIALQSVEDGAIVALAGTLNESVNFISGLNRVENAVDAVVGEPDETDAALRTRREESLSISGGSTPAALLASLLQLEGVTAARVVENVTDVTDPQGRPPHSFESVVQGGLDADIADIIFQNKPAGIDTFGSVTVVVEDTNGEPFDINFSRPTEVEIYVEVDLSVNAQFPSDGLLQVENAILAFGAAQKIGNDVIVFGSDSLSSAINSIPGITDYVIRIDDAPAPTTDDNVIIQPDELAVFDSTRTTVVTI